MTHLFEFRRAIARPFRRRHRAGLGLYRFKNGRKRRRPNFLVLVGAKRTPQADRVKPESRPDSVGSSDGKAFHRVSVQALAFVTALNTSFRLEEVCRLRWSDLKYKHCASLARHSREDECAPFSLTVMEHRISLRGVVSIELRPAFDGTSGSPQ